MTTLKSLIRVGAKIPSGFSLQIGSPNNTVDAAQHLSKHARAVLFGVPGAFTPGCSKTHLPGFLQEYDALRTLGVEYVGCISVNDAFVMDAWGKANHADGKVEMLADPRGEFLGDMGLTFDATAVLGSHRAKRFVMLLEKGEVKYVSVEPNNTGLTCTLASNLIEQLKKQL